MRREPGKSDNLSDLENRTADNGGALVSAGKSDKLSDLNIPPIPPHIHAYLAERLPQAASDISLLDESALLETAVRGLQMELVGKLQAGLALMRLKAQVGHGSYLAALTDVNIHERTARRCVDLAALALRVPAEAWQGLSNLSAAKLALVQDWPTADIEALCAGSEVRGLTYQMALALPAPECRELIAEHAEANRALRGQLATQTAALATERAQREIAEIEAERLREQLQSRPRARLPVSVVCAREESAALGTQALAALDELAVLIEALHTTADLDPDPMKADAQRGAAVSNVWLHLNAVHARCELLRARMQLVFSVADLPASPEATSPLDPVEAERILAAREQFLIEHRAATVARAQRRIDDGTVKRGRGRPKKQG